MKSLRYTSKKELIVEVLQEEVMTGQLAPGHVLRQEDLAQRFGVSITPVREALRELGARGLLAHEAHRGVRVAERTREEHEEVTAIRELLEPFATRLAAPLMTDEELDELDELNRRVRAAFLAGEVIEVQTLNYDLHMRIYRAARTVHLLPLIERIWAAFEWASTRIPPDRLPPELMEHSEILAALRRHDGDAAAEAMREHVALGGRLLAEIGELRPVVDGHAVDGRAV